MTEQKDRLDYLQKIRKEQLEKSPVVLARNYAQPDTIALAKEFQQMQEKEVNFVTRSLSLLNKAIVWDFEEEITERFQITAKTVKSYQSSGKGVLDTCEIPNSDGDDTITLFGTSFLAFFEPEFFTNRKLGSCDHKLYIGPGTSHLFPSGFLDGVGLDEERISLETFASPQTGRTYELVRFEDVQHLFASVGQNYLRHEKRGDFDFIQELDADRLALVLRAMSRGLKPRPMNAVENGTKIEFWKSPPLAEDSSEEEGEDVQEPVQAPQSNEVIQKLLRTMVLDAQVPYQYREVILDLLPQFK